MALTRGASSNFPCPVCLVPKEEMHKGKVYPLRTTKTMKEVYHKAMGMALADMKEELLKSVGLRGIEVRRIFPHSTLYSCYITLIWKNAFWGLRNSDPYQALSFDRLHAFHLGLFKDHIWAVLKAKIELAGRLAIKKVDEQLVNFTSLLSERSDIYISKSVLFPTLEWT